MKARETKSDSVCLGGEQLIEAKHPASDDIRARIKSLQQRWNALRELAENRREQLEDALEAYQVRVGIYGRNDDGDTIGGSCGMGDRLGRVKNRNILG